jgi:hypothetical protein
VSWYPSRNYRVLAEYGFSSLDAGGMTGYTHYFQTRLQFLFN